MILDALAEYVLSHLLDRAKGVLPDSVLKRLDGDTSLRAMLERDILPKSLEALVARRPDLQADPDLVKQVIAPAIAHIIQHSVLSGQPGAVADLQAELDKLLAHDLTPEQRITCAALLEDYQQVFYTQLAQHQSAGDALIVQHLALMRAQVDRVLAVVQDLFPSSGRALPTAELDELSHLAEDILDRRTLIRGKIFLSYSRQNRSFARALHAKLLRMGFDLWRDVHDIEADTEDWWHSIQAAIEGCETVILCMSLPALKSPVVSDEWMHAREHGKRIIAVVADDIWTHPEVTREKDPFVIPNWMQRKNWMDFRAGVPENEAAWANLIRTLNEKPETKRFIRMVSELPPRFVRRPMELNRAIGALVDDNHDAVAMTTALKGAGGYGKTTLAKAVARDIRIQGAFDDGILWVTLGEELLKKQGEALNLALIGLVQELIDALKAERPVITSLDMARTQLEKAIGDAYILLVVDDVWDERHLAPFLVKTKHSACLITTRSTEALGKHPIDHQLVDKMQPLEAVELLCAGIAEDDWRPHRAALTRLARDLREYPLLLGLVNTQMTNLMDDMSLPVDEALALVREALDEGGVFGFDDTDTDDRNRAVSNSLEVSIRQLKPEDRQRMYRELAIFAEDAVIPLTTLERYWGLTKSVTLQFCQTLYRKTALLHSFEGMAVRIHDVFRDCLIRHWDPAQRQALHQRLIAAWGDPTALPDPYAWRYIAYHLIEGGQTDRLYDLLLDHRWLQAKLDTTDTNALIADCQAYRKQLPDAPGAGGETIRVLQSALTMSAHRLADDKQALAHQLVGRLMTWRRDDPALRALTDRLMAEVDGLYPAFPDSDYAVLEQAGGALIRTLTGHTDGVSHVALTPDGATAVSASEDNTLRVWDVTTGALRHTLTGHTNSVVHVALTLDGTTIVSASADDTLRVWDLETGALRHTLTGHTSWVAHVALTADGTTAVSTSDDHTLRVWDVATGALRHTLTGHTEGVRHIALTADGATAVSASAADRTLRVWDVATGALRHTLTGHTNGVIHVALTADGATAVSASEDNTLRVWDMATGALRHTLTGHTSWVAHVALTADGATAVSASMDKTLRVWDIESGALIHNLTGHTSGVNHVALTADGATAVSASGDKTLRVWELETGVLIHTLLGHSNAVNHVALTQDSRRAISASNDQTVRVWDVESGALIHNLTGHSNAVNHIVLTPDRQQAFSASWDMTFRVWDLETGTALGVFDANVAGRTALAEAFPKFSDISTRQWRVDHSLTWDGNRLSAAGTAFHSDARLSDAVWVIAGETLMAGDSAGRVIFLRVRK